jgi:hypothetical protein
MRSPKLIALLVSVAILLGVVGTAAALDSTRSISVTFRGISVAVNGKVVPTEQEPFVYEGRTYVPLRAVAEALGQDVSWDEESSQVRINGRVAIRDVSGEIVTDGYNRGGRAAWVRGIITNSSDKTVVSVAVKCPVTDSTGTQRVIHEVLQGSVPPKGLTKFRIGIHFDSEDAKTQAQVPATCQLLEVVYADR